LQVAQNVHIPRIGEDEMFSVSDTLLSLRSGLKREHFAWFGRDGEEHDPIDGPTPLFNPALSPDGRTLAANGGPSREPGLWLIDLNARVATRIHSEAIGPIWSPDGRELAFTARGGLEIRRRATTGPTEEVLLLHDSARKVLQDWSPDGRYLVYSTMSDAGGVDLWMLPSSGASPPTPLMTTPANERQAQISPDGKWIAYTSDESGRPEVYIQTFPGLGTKRAVSADGGTTPFWRRDGRELFYLSAAGQLYAVPLHLGDGVSVGPPLLLFRVPRGLDASAARNVYVPAPDGETFLFNVTDENTEHAAITVIVNWRAQLAVSRTATPAADRPRTAWAATSRRPLPSGTTRS
jgi:dipeptidyl aminopeptidase/acylaminoacyl peptidase